MSYGSLCMDCRHLASRHMLSRGGDLRRGPYRCLDCECSITQDAPMLPLSKREYEAEKAAGLPTWEVAGRATALNIELQQARSEERRLTVAIVRRHFGDKAADIVWDELESERLTPSRAAQEKPTSPRSEAWRVIRHGGRSSDDWRELFVGAEDKAREQYNTRRYAMRQGGIRLIDPNGNMEAGEWAPTLRTRW